MVYRAAPGPAAPRQPVAAPEFRRNERVIVEWPLVGKGEGEGEGEIEAHEVRLLGRDGQPLALAVPAARTAGGRPAIVADLNLAPLTAGEYAIEVSVTSEGRTDRHAVAVRVGR